MVGHELGSIRDTLKYVIGTSDRVSPNDINSQVRSYCPVGWRPVGLLAFYYQPDSSVTPSPVEPFAKGSPGLNASFGMVHPPLCQANDIEEIERLASH